MEEEEEEGEAEEGDTAGDGAPEGEAEVTEEMDAALDATLRFLKGDPWFEKYHQAGEEHWKKQYQERIGARKYTPVEFPSLGSSVLSTAALAPVLRMVSSAAQFEQHQRLHAEVARQWKKLKKADSLWSSMSSLQRAMFATTSHCHDLLHCCRTWENEEEVMEAVCLQVLNHIYKNRGIRQHHAARMARLAKELQGEDEQEPEVRDQGFTHCNVLLLLPFRNIAFRYVEKLVQILGDTDVVGAESFAEKFGSLDEGQSFQKQPADYQRQFRGNIDDEFCYGVAFRPDGVHLGCNFYKSDLIVASPLTLLNQTQKEENGKRDFLSSIELVVVDQADTILMQNWEWLEELVDLCCRPPKNVRNTMNYARVHPWHVARCAPFFMQSIILSRYHDPRFAAFFDRKLCNITGRVTVQQVFQVGSVGRVFNGTRSIIQRLAVDSPPTASDVHFAFFTKTLFPQLTQRMTTVYGQKGLILFVPSYFDYVRLRNFLEETDKECFRELCEYTSPRDINTAVRDFGKGDCNVVLMTERFYFFKRLPLKRARNIIFYRPPLNAQFYDELINLLNTTSDTPLTYLFFNRYDVQALARIVGTERAKRMVLAEKDTHLLA
eukprot:GGOE01036959.1.p1 GENE.GGOE01036959.1~~GGOE01036959.1.p1  ORF type:complete len:629 (+),score=251.23 GGOE01036959.1:70-1887(+)